MKVTDYTLITRAYIYIHSLYIISFCRSRKQGLDKPNQLQFGLEGEQKDWGVIIRYYNFEIVVMCSEKT